jgi:lysyl-tRNA synthetase class II
LGQKIKNVAKKIPFLGDEYAPVTEGVAFLKKKKEEKKKSSSKYLTQRDAGKVAKRVMAKKDQEKVNFLEPEETNESKTRLVKNGHTYKVVLTWRGKTYMVHDIGDIGQPHLVGFASDDLSLVDFIRTQQVRILRVLFIGYGGLWFGIECLDARTGSIIEVPFD